MSNTLNPALEKLAKVIRLEAERAYDNQAVVGGLENMLESWRTQAEEAGLSSDTIELVQQRLVDYRRLSPESRRENLHGLWNRLSKLESNLPDLPELVKKPPPRETPAGPANAQAQAPAASQPSEATAQIPPAKRAQERVKAAMSAPLTTIPGIGPKSAKTLRKLGLESLSDLLWHLPRRYDDYSQLQTINRLFFGQEVTIIATVEEVGVRPVRSGRMKLTEATVSDGTGSLRVTWFNQPWIADKLKPGKAVVLSAKVDQYLGRLTMNNPEWEPLEKEQLHTNRIVPVYPLTAGVTSKWLRRVMHSVVHRLAPKVEDPLPENVRKDAGLMDLGAALQQVHFPDDWDAVRKAQHRLAFDEMFMLQLGVLRQKQEWESQETKPLPVEDSWLEHFLNALPFPLTDSQAQVLAELRDDLASPRPMNRLLEGDVGSGKTILAAAALGIAAQHGAQSAIMAPTSILAEQHYATLQDLLPEAGGIARDSIVLLIGATPESEKEAIRNSLANGEIAVVVGTHALLEDPVTFQDLRLAIVDEQHRFGVEQRAVLRAKGNSPNLLVMTATPIPRSLALTIYGDLDVSILDELPPGRKPVETRVLSPIERSRAYNFVIGQLEKGHQAFIIYPLVEESEKLEAKAAVEEYETLRRDVFFNYEVGLLHGRMKPHEKEAIMQAFRAGEYHVLVSTSVVEVGVDIPNASVVLIEGANRFGLAQLHQFRGRVGRSEYRSYCLLIPDSEEASDNERLKAMEQTGDGFELAELDLEQRGPGDFFGTRQSGFAALHLADITDVRLIQKARTQARSLFDRDPGLERPEHAALAQTLNRFWSDGRGEQS